MEYRCEIRACRQDRRVERSCALAWEVTGSSHGGQQTEEHDLISLGYVEHNGRKGKSGLSLEQIVNTAKQRIPDEYFNPLPTPEPSPIRPVK